VWVHGAGDEKYCALLESNLKEAMDEFVPDVLFYNAGNGGQCQGSY
jgi:acetoin utilization deacetylase AcuC-like enzyme